MANCYYNVCVWSSIDQVPVPGKHSSRFSRDSEAIASEFLNNLELIKW